MTAQKELEMAAETSITFKTTDQMEQALQKVCYQNDRNKSEVIRACITIALPVLVANPSLIYRLDFSELKLNKIKVLQE